MERTGGRPPWVTVGEREALGVICKLGTELTDRDDIVTVEFRDGSTCRVRSRRYAPPLEKVDNFIRGCEAHIAERYARDMTPRG